ncbi:MAG TPA: dihydroorotate dehydrogenase electron transfer subunit [Bacillota bacterium]|nr:dihydroorotate dehydrogenase electron transfer subunit [Bacillota bacterium]
MRHIQKAPIYSKKWIAKDTVELIIQSKDIATEARPGQFLHIHVPGHTLRRPISIAHIDREHDLITILFKELGSGTKTLATLEAGEEVNMLGPLGNGFPLDQTEGSTSLLIGGGIGVPPLYALGNALKEKGVRVVSVLGYQTKEHVFYEEQFQQLGETIIVTDDGSYGKKGLVTDGLSFVNQVDHFYTCGPKPMIKAVVDAMETTPGHISLEERMGCGLGACFACVVPTEDEKGYKKICQDGPVFSVEEVVL